MTGDPPRLWLEDLPVGRRFRFGSYAVSRDEVIEFASKYDPQPYHVDDEAAAANPIFGRLSASGLHTMAIANMLVFQGHLELGLQPVAGGGLDELRLLKPVFPGDVVRVEQEVVEARSLASKPGRGIIRLVTTTFNQDDEAVMRHRAILFIESRPAGSLP